MRWKLPDHLKENSDRRHKPGGLESERLDDTFSACVNHGGEELAKKLPDAYIVKAFSTIPASFIPHAFYRPAQLQRLWCFTVGISGTSKLAVHQLIADSGFAGLDAGPLRLARELEAPGRLHRAGLVGIAEAKRLLKEITESVQNEQLVSSDCDQRAFTVAR